MTRQRIVITGAAGAIAGSAIAALGEEHDLVLLDQVSHATRDIRVADLADRDALMAVMPPADVLIHLGAIPGEADPESIINSNIRGTYNAFDVAHERGVRRIIFASTIMIYNGMPPITPASNYSPARDGWSTTHYAVSKIYAEELGRFFHAKHGIAMIGIRFGWYPRSAFSDRKTPLLCHTLGLRDCERLFRRAVAAENVSYGVVNGVSKGGDGYYDLEPGRLLLGFEPEDDGDEARRQHLIHWEGSE